MPEPRELMIIFAGEPYAAGAAGEYRVQQRISPRVLIVEPSHDSTRETLRSAVGVLAVLELGEGAPDGVRRLLTEVEVISVDAFGRRAQPKERQGDGLPWDAPGFLSPDPQEDR